MPPGNPPPTGHIGTPEAAELLGVHQQTIRNYVRDGKLEGFKEYDTETKRERYWVKLDAIDRLLAEKAHEPVHLENADQLSRRTEDILERIASQENATLQRALELHEQLHVRLDRLEERQERISENLAKAVDILEELGERSKAFQDRMLELLEEEREALRQQREEMGRGFWGRFFRQR